jgi:microcystin-dependent protein
MRKIILSLILAAFTTAAQAGVPCSVPFQLQNGTTADATQVMANYNALISCLSNAAAAGVNNDITALSALATPLTPAQGGSVTYIAVAPVDPSTGAAVIPTTLPANFVLQRGAQVVFIVSANNTGAVTLNVAGTGVKSFYRRNQNGAGPMVGGELVTPQMVVAAYDGFQWQLVSSPPVLIGEIRDFAGSTAPPGWLFADGSCQLRSQYVELFNLIGATYDPTGSTCDVTHFALPDLRGRVTMAPDNQGVNGAANRVTLAGSGCNGTIIGGAGCGAQNHTQTLAELVSHNHGITEPNGGTGHNHTFNSGGSSNVGGLQGTGSGAVQGAVTVSNSVTGITINNAGSGSAMPILNPLQIVTKIIKP